MEALWTLNSSFHQLKTLEGLRAAERGLLYLLVGVSGCIVSQSRFYLLGGSSIIGLLTPSRNCVSCVYRSSVLSETGRRWPLLSRKQEDPGCGGNLTQSVSLFLIAQSDRRHIPIFLAQFKCYSDGFHQQVDCTRGNSLENGNQTPSWSLWWWQSQRIYALSKIHYSCIFLS